MIKIAFFAPWWRGPKEAKISLSVQTSNRSGRWGKIEAVDKAEKADYFVIWQRDTLDSAKLPQKRKVYLQREPEVIQSSEHLYSKSDALFVNTYSNSYQFVKWWVGRTYDELKAQAYHEKTLKLNSIMSHKRFTYGHKARTEFLTDFLLRYPEEIDVFGTFKNIYPYLVKEKSSFFWSLFNTFIFDKLPKQTNKFDKFDLTLPYKYSFVAENCVRNNYFTEKIVDAYLSWSLPIYWGCPNIGDYFPEDSYYSIDINNDDSLERLYEIIQKPITANNIEAMRQARELILDRYNVWPALEKVFRSAQYEN